MEFYGNVIDLDRVEGGYKVTVYVPEPPITNIRQYEEGTKEYDEAKRLNQEMDIKRLMMSRIHYSQCLLVQNITDEEHGLVKADKA